MDVEANNSLRSQIALFLETTLSGFCIQRACNSCRVLGNIIRPTN